MKFKLFPYHPFLIVAFQILSIYSININEVNFDTLIIVLSISLLFTAISYFMISFFVNIRLSAIILTFYGFLFFVYGRTLDILIDYPILSFDLGRNRYLLPFYVIIVILGTILIIKSKFFSKNLELVTKYFNNFALGLVIIAILTSMMNFDWTLLLKKDIEKIKPEKSINLISKVNNNTKPNIYFIIFDSYVSPRILRKYYSWSDSMVVDGLQSRGFYVEDNTRSNYCFSGASVGATLSMRYIHEDKEFINAYNQDNYITKLYTDNEVMKILKSNGYKIQGNIGLNNFPSNKQKKSLLSDDFIKLIIHISALRIIQKRIIIDQIRQDILKLLKGLKNPIDSNKPTFTYVHIVAPHSPFVFNADGSRPKYFESSFGKFEDKIKFLNQVKFVGKEMIEIADSLLINDPNAIIIFQSDHGFGGMDDHIYLNRFSKAAKNNDRKKPPADYLDRRFGILNAIYLPENMKVPQNITPVNLFRHLLNNLFDYNLEMLPDNQYFAVIKQPYFFHNISEDLKNLNE